MFVLLNMANLQPKAANEVPAPSHEGEVCSGHTVRQMYVEYCWFKLNCCFIRVICYFIWNLNFSQKHSRGENIVAWSKKRPKVPPLHQIFLASHMLPSLLPCFALIWLHFFHSSMKDSFLQPSPRACARGIHALRLAVLRQNPHLRQQDSSRQS